MTNFGKLFQPLGVGTITLPNRIVMMPHAMMLSGGYGPTIQRVADYHVERAKGGVGLIVMSNFLMPPSWRRLGSWGGELSNTALGGLDLANDRDLLPHYLEMIARIHAEGAYFVSQLNASGRQLRSPGTVPFGLPLFAPSPLACPRTGEIPKQMTHADIAEYVQTMVAAARNLRDAGGDGVELFAAQGYLLHEFLSPATNWRDDEYGGSLENRMRFLVDTVRAIRQETGAEFLIGVRINASDQVAGGLELADATEIACRLEAEGVDYLNVSGMTSLHYPGWISDITAPTAQFAPEAGAIRQAITRPAICVSSRIATPQEAESVLQAGQADLIGLARALISDPQWPDKARRGIVDDIRKCTYSNQTCIVGLDRGRGVGCMHNVAVGKEAQLGIGTMRPAKQSRHVAVVGGGPAGMAAARVAAERGHLVHLFERADVLGGQNRLAATISTRRGLSEVMRWQEHMLRKMANVTLSTARTVSRQTIAEGGFDAVVLATGSSPRRTGYTSLRPQARTIPGIDKEHVLTVWEALDGSRRVGRRVVVLEDDPHLAGVATAEHLAEMGHRVTIITPHMHAGSDLPVQHTPALYRGLAKAGVEVVPHNLVIAIADHTIICEDRFSGRRFEFGDIDSLVLAMGNQANDELAGELEGLVETIMLVGDCVAPRQIEHAILDGERSGWML